MSGLLVPLEYTVYRQLADGVTFIRYLSIKSLRGFHHPSTYPCSVYCFSTFFISPSMRFVNHVTTFQSFSKIFIQTYVHTFAPFTVCLLNILLKFLTE